MQSFFQEILPDNIVMLSGVEAPFDSAQGDKVLE